MKNFTVLSLGAGVQSSCLALMAANGEIGPVPDFAIFADTGAEPKSVYQWLEHLTAEIQKCPHPFPVHIVKKGGLLEDSLVVRTSKNGGTYMRAMIPYFVRKPNGKKGMSLNRICTADYKIIPITQELRRRCGIKRGQKEATIVQWIGISSDEAQRAKESRQAWITHRWPLIELRMDRNACKEWMVSNGYPVPPKSACSFCPFHSDADWARLKEREPEAFEQAANFEEELREKNKSTKYSGMVPFLHPSIKPLREIDFSHVSKDELSLWQDMRIECAGMCGV